MNDVTLMHYGVLGMKWRHRKARATRQSSKKRHSLVEILRRSN